MDLGLFFLCVSGWCPVRKIVRERAEGMDRCVKCVFSSPGQVHSNSLQVGKSLLVYCLTSPFLTLNFFFFGCSHLKYCIYLSQLVCSITPCLSTLTLYSCTIFFFFPYLMIPLTPTHSFPSSSFLSREYGSRRDM